MARQGTGTVSARRLALIEQIIAERAVHPLFQPIVDLRTRDLVGVEALARGPAGSALEFPDALFAAATEAGLLTELDQLCCARALETARVAGPLAPPLVFVNAEPAGLRWPMSPDLAAVVNGGLPFRIVLEFTERALTGRPAALLRLSDLVHGIGNAVALDDVGADPASLAFLPLVEPDVVKLDMHLLHEPYSARTQATADTVAGYAERSGAIVLAEGIETPENAMNAAALGARWGQGWLFGRPGPLDALLDRRHATPTVFTGTPGAETSPDDTPFTLASQRLPARTAGPDMVNALTDHVVTTAQDRGRQGIVLCAINQTGRPPSWLPRLTAAVDRVTFLGLLSDAPLPHVEGVQTQQLGAGDPLCGETVIAVLGEDFFTALCLKPLRRTGATEEHTTQFVYSHDRQIVQTIMRSMMRRFDTW
jgi:EAL domain-containing protein (putative c-di-GMP-specific phosphodiesterase class I)